MGEDGAAFEEATSRSGERGNSGDQGVGSHVRAIGVADECIGIAADRVTWRALAAAIMSTRDRCEY